MVTFIFYENLYKGIEKINVFLQDKEIEWQPVFKELDKSLKDIIKCQNFLVL